MRAAGLAWGVGSGVLGWGGGGTVDTHWRPSLLRSRRQHWRWPSSSQTATRLPTILARGPWGVTFPLAPQRRGQEEADEPAVRDT